MAILVIAYGEPTLPKRQALTLTRGVARISECVPCPHGKLIGEPNCGAPVIDLIVVVGDSVESVDTWEAENKTILTGMAVHRIPT